MSRMQVRFHTRTISVTTNNGLFPIEAQVLWPFAVHLVPLEDETHGYNITHIPTGYMFTNVRDHLTAGMAIAALLELQFDWSVPSTDPIVQWNKFNQKAVTNALLPFRSKDQDDQTPSFWPGEIEVEVEA